MIDLIWEKHSTWDHAPTFFGGDFNVEARNVTSSVQAIYPCDNNNNAIPTTNGAGTNQDAVIVLDPEATWLYTRPTRVNVIEDVLSGTGQVRIQAIVYAALLTRTPYGIGVLTGTGLTPPVWP